MKRTYTVVLIGLLISMEIVLTRFLSIQTMYIRIGFGFLPIAVASMLFGPIVGGMVYAISDFIGVVIAPNGAFFPGFTVSAFLTGLVYGLVLYKKPKGIIRVFLAVVIIRVFINMGLNTYWVWVTTTSRDTYQFWNLFLHWERVQREFIALLPVRVQGSLIMIPVQTGVIYCFWRYLGKFIETKVLPRIALSDKTA